MRFYRTNIAEYLKDGYFKDNTLICNEKYPAFTFITSEITGNVLIYELNEHKFNRKEIDESLVKSIALSSYDDGLYLEEQTADSVGLFRYKLDLTDSEYYSDPFQIISARSRETFTLMDSGILNIYDADFLENTKDGYFDINTTVNFDRYLSMFYFDSLLTISSIDAEIRVIDKSKLDRKITSDYKLQDLTLTNSGTVVYLATPTYLDLGMYRLKITVTPTVGSPEVFYSEIFCIIQIYDWILEEGIWNDLGVWIDNETWQDS